VRALQIDTVVIAQTFASQEDLWHLVSVCQRTTARVKVLPDHAQVFEGSYRDPLTLRDVSIDDILGRTSARVSGEQCERILTGKTVMVTGAAGSIGSELCRQVLRHGPSLLLAVDNNETGLYELGMELNGSERDRLELVVGDVTDQRKMNLVFGRYSPDVVFHAAAYKHVPLMEHHVDEAVRINLIGTIVVTEMAHRYGAERFVFVSTDKAVNPSSVMGASKRVGEMFTMSMAAHSATLFTAVRFGNVIGSRGSVFPTFARQIEAGGPVTITDPEMYRYFISIPEAVSLVLQAAAFDQTGRIYMLDMGEEVSIVDLANRMIRLRGLRPRTDIEIEFAGRRPGEKLHEELSYTSEAREETTHPRVYALQCAGELADHDALLGAILVLARLPQFPGA
jgi:FlaA1/EpsC-like NDP-sugar epimerase